MQNQLRIRKTFFPLAMFTATVLFGANMNTGRVDVNGNQTEAVLTDNILLPNEKDVFDYMKHSSGLMGANLAMCLFGIGKRKQTVETAAPVERTETSVLENNHKVILYFNNNNVLTTRMEYDETERFIDEQIFDSDGAVIKHMHKDYFENKNEKGNIEYYKDQNQEYTRKAYNKYEGEERHYIEEYNSITNPERNYKYISIYVMDKLVKIIQNGEVIFDKT